MTQKFSHPTSRVLHSGETLIITTWEGSGCKPGPHPVQAPSRMWETRGPGTLQGLGGDSSAPRPRKSGTPRALEIPRAPRNAARLPGNQEKNFCFFFLFWHSGSPRTLLLALAPTWDAPARRPDADQSPCGFANGRGGRPQKTRPIFQFIKGGAQGCGLRSLKPVARLFPLLPPGLFLLRTLQSFSAFWGEDFAAIRRSGTSAQAPWEGFGLSCFGFSIFSFGTVVGLLSTVDYNCNMTLEELVACDNAAQK